MVDILKEVVSDAASQGRVQELDERDAHQAREHARFHSKPGPGRPRQTEATRIAHGIKLVADRQSSLLMHKQTTMGAMTDAIEDVKGDFPEMPEDMDQVCTVLESDISAELAKLDGINRQLVELNVRQIEASLFCYFVCFALLPVAAMWADRLVGGQESISFHLK